MLAIPKIQYTREESDEAHATWKASCGHHSIAAACGITLNQVRAHIPHEKGWMSPSNIQSALKSLGVAFDTIKGLRTLEPCQGINRIQFEGDWLNPGRVG